MLKKILILGSQRKKSQEIIDFFKKQQKYKIVALLCSDEKQQETFRKQIKEIKPSIVFFPNKEIAEKIEEEFNIKCFFDYSEYNVFLKNTDCDLVISDFTGIDSVKLILATIAECKDIGLLNLEPILYSGKIVINEAKIKGIKLNYITSQFKLLTYFLKTRNINDIKKIILMDYDTKEDKENIINYTSPSKQISELKKVLYFKNKMWLARHLIVFSQLYDLDLECFDFYKSNTDKINLILQLEDGSSLFNYLEDNKESIYKQYYLENQNIKEKQKPIEETINIKLQHTNSDSIPTLKLAKQAILKGGCFPILYQIAYDVCADNIYKNKSSEDCFIKIFKKILEDKNPLYYKNPNIQTIFALYEKIEKEIRK